MSNGDNRADLVDLSNIKCNSRGVYGTTFEQCLEARIKDPKKCSGCSANSRCVLCAEPAANKGLCVSHQKDWQRENKKRMISRLNYIKEMLVRGGEERAEPPAITSIQDTPTAVQEKIRAVQEQEGEQVAKEEVAEDSEKPLESSPSELSDSESTPNKPPPADDSVKEEIVPESTRGVALPAVQSQPAQPAQPAQPDEQPDEQPVEPLLAAAETALTETPVKKTAGLPLSRQIGLFAEAVLKSLLAIIVPDTIIKVDSWYDERTKSVVVAITQIPHDRIGLVIGREGNNFSVIYQLLTILVNSKFRDKVLLRLDLIDAEGRSFWQERVEIVKRQLRQALNCHQQGRRAVVRIEDTFLDRQIIQSLAPKLLAKAKDVFVARGCLEVRSHQQHHQLTTDIQQSLAIVQSIAEATGSDKTGVVIETLQKCLRFV